MSGRDMFAAAIFALAVIGAIRVVRFALSSCKRALRSFGRIMRAVGETLAGDEDDAPSAVPQRPNRKRAKVAIPTISDSEIAEYLARRGAAPKVEN